MIHTAYDETLIFDYKIALQNNTDMNINYFGLPKEKYVYNGITYEPFQLTELAFFGAEYFENPDNFIEIDFTEIYKYKPQYLAHEYYGNPKLGYLILYANKLDSVVEFIPENLNGKIKIMKFEKLLEISNGIDLKDLRGKTSIEIKDNVVYDF